MVLMMIRMIKVLIMTVNFMLRQVKVRLTTTMIMISVMISTVMVMVMIMILLMTGNDKRWLIDENGDRTANENRN